MVTPVSQNSPTTGTTVFRRAKKQPLSDAQQAMNGRPSERMRRGRAASGLRMKRSARKSAPKNSAERATALSASARPRQRATHPREAFPSAARRVMARPNPEVHAVTPRENTEKISWYSPMPLAPMRAVMTERNQRPSMRSSTLLTVSTAALKKNLRFLPI